MNKKLVAVILVVLAATISVAYALVQIINHTAPAVTVPAAPFLSSTCTTLTANPGTSGSTTVLLTCGTSPAFLTTAACSPSCTATAAATFPAQPSYNEFGLVLDGTRNAAGNSPCGPGTGFIGQVPGSVPVSLQVTFSAMPAPGQVSLGSYDYCLFYATTATGGTSIPSFQITWSQ